MPRRVLEVTQLTCSFCGRSDAQVRRLVAGAAGGYICDACVAIAARIIASSDSPTPQRTLWQRVRSAIAGPFRSHSQASLLVRA
jgi:ATP-dependent protease Clp ATPase subunit